MVDKEITIKVKTETEGTDELDNLEDKIDDLDGSTVKPTVDNTEVTELEAEIDNLKTIIEEETAYGFDTSESEAELSELESRLDELKAKAEEGATFQINGEDGGLDDLANTMEGFNDLMVGEVLERYGSSAEDMAQQMNTANISVGQLAKNAGMAEPQMVGLINHISNATFPQNEAMAYVKMLNQMGVSSDKIGESATNIDKINDATGMGYQNAMSLVRGYGALGVSADNIDSIFNNVAYAEANSVGGAEELGTVLKMQSGVLNEYGIGADSATVAISQLSHTYGTARKAGSALSTALKDNNGDLSAVEKELGLTAGSLTNASQLTSEYDGKLQDLADEEMEHKSLLDQLGAMWEDLSLSIGGVMSPIMGVIGLGGQIAGFGMQLNGTWELLSKFRNISFISNLGGTLSGALSSIGGAFSSLWGIIMANPIILVVIAIVALITALIWAYYNVDWFREMVDGAFASLMQIGQIIMSYIMPVINWLANTFQQFTSQLGLNTNDWIQAILGFILFIPTLPLQIGIALANALAKAFGFKGNFVQTLWQTAVEAVNKFGQAIQGIGKAIQNCLNWAKDIIMNHPIVKAVQWLGEQLAWIFSHDGLNQSSPGDIAGAMEDELDWTQEEIENNSLAGSTAKMGQNISQNFNPNLNGANGANGFAYGGNTLNINIENVDNDERVQQIVEAVKKALKWNNVTAGREV